LDKRQSGLAFNIELEKDWDFEGFTGKNVFLKRAGMLSIDATGLHRS
jgi:hypothetical protein